jgi:hypothetical protein
LAPPLIGAIGLDDTTGENRTVGFEPLAGDFKSELVESGERGQIRAGEGSVRQVEVFQMASVRTSIIGRPRRLPATGSLPATTPSAVKSRQTSRDVPIQLEASDGNLLNNPRFSKGTRELQ